MQKYKAIIFDLDGTAIPSRLDGMPSKKLINTVEKAKKKILVSAATGRTYDYCKDVLHALDLESPCVVSGGSQIIDPTDGKIIWEQPLSEDQLKHIYDIYSKDPHGQLYFNDDIIDTSPAFSNDVRIVYLIAVSKQITPSISEKLLKIPDIAVHLVPSWEDEENNFDIHITHAFATKAHGIEKLLQILDVQKSEVVGVGDSNNDMPLFESVGYKVAMGNGMEELKKAADFVAPDIENDGLVYVLEKIT